MNALHPLGAAVCAAAALVFGTQAGTTRPVDTPGLAATYEHLAGAIIAIRDTETSLVRDMLRGSFDAAIDHLDAAADATGSDRRSHVEAAAAAVTEIATEGDKQVQAVRQRLLRAGHHHHTDAATEADYIFIDGMEKKELIGMAGILSRIGPSAPQRQFDEVKRDLRRMFKSAIAPE